MNPNIHLQLQSVQLGDLLRRAGDDPILKPQLETRLRAVNEELSQTDREAGKLFPEDLPALPRAAIFLRGGGVQGSAGIRPSLAGESLILYEKMFTEQALHDERQSARKQGRHRRPRGSSTPCLLFTGTPRGSFGLEFVPQATEDVALLAVHGQSLQQLAASLEAIADADGSSLDETLERIPPRVLQPMKRFFSVLAGYNAELKLASSVGPPRDLSADQIKKASERLERELKAEEVQYIGTFRGLTRESGFFDIIVNNETITGSVADELSEEDLERIDQLVNRPCMATLQVTAISQLSGNRHASYLLIDAIPVVESAPITVINATVSKDQ